MALILEQRGDTKPRVTTATPCHNGMFSLDHDYAITIAQARELCRLSNGLPLEERAFVFRIGFKK